MSTIKVVNIQHPDSVEPNLVLQTDGDTVFASGLTVSGTFDIANDLTVSGNTGLGTSSPTSKLHVVDTTTNLQLESTADSSSGKIDFVGKDASSNSYRTLTIDTNSTGEVNIETDPDNGGYSTDKSIIFKQAGSEKARIDNSGNIGIGTTNLSSGERLKVTTASSSATSLTGLNALTVESNSDTGISILTPNSNIGSLAFGDPENGAIGRIRYLHSDNSLLFQTNGSETMRIDSSGYVGVGTSSPGSRLHVEGTTGSNSRVHISSTSNGDETFDGSGSGLLLTAGGMNTTSKFTPAIQFGSTDPNFTTTNPKIGAAINAIARETFGSDTDGGMDLAFYTTPRDPGTGQTTTERMRIDFDGNVTINNDLAVNTDTLYVDTTNDRVGIGTASPSEALDIQGGLLINGANVTAVLSGTIADDAFYSLDLTAEGFMLGGLATITTFSTYDNFPQAIGTGMFYYDCGNSLSGARILSDADSASPLVGGTTSTSTVITDFTDGRATIICNANTLRIANRLGGNRRFKLTFL